MTAAVRTEEAMRVDIYTLDDCPTCERIHRYCKHLCRGGGVCRSHDLNSIDTHENRVQMRADLAWQNDAAPLVYIDGEYQELDDVIAKVKAWEIAKRNDYDRCSKDFIL